MPNASAEATVQTILRDLAAIRATNPVVLSITNYVVTNTTANAMMNRTDTAVARKISWLALTPAPTLGTHPAVRRGGAASDLPCWPTGPLLAAGNGCRGSASDCEGVALRAAAAGTCGGLGSGGGTEAVGV